MPVHGNNCYMNAPQFYVVLTLPLLLLTITDAVSARCGDRKPKVTEMKALS